MNKKSIIVRLIAIVLLSFKFSHTSLQLGWRYLHINQMLNALLAIALAQWQTNAQVNIEKCLSLIELFLSRFHT